MTPDWIFCVFIIVVGTIPAVCMFFGIRDNFREELCLRFGNMADEIEDIYANNHLVAEDLETHLAGIKRKWEKST